jgi:hypothetical protein
MSVICLIYGSNDLGQTNVTPVWRRHHVKIPPFDGEMVFPPPPGVVRDFSFWLRLKTEPLLFLMAF